MIVILFALNIKKNQQNNIFNKIKNMFLFNKIDLNLEKYGDINIVNIDMTLRRGKVNWKKIIKILGNNKKILCSESLELPENLGIFRYESNKLNEELCKNSALEVLKTSKINKEKFKLVIYDPCGNHVDFLSKVINFSRNIIVVTDNKDLYVEEQTRLLREYGVSVLITDNRDWTYNSNLIISPEGISEPLQVSFNSVVFTSKASRYCLSGRVYNKYEVNNIEKYIKIKPKGLEINYFLNVIYDKYSLKSLGEQTPEYCYYCEEKIYLKSISKTIML